MFQDPTQVHDDVIIVVSNDLKTERPKILVPFLVFVELVPFGMGIAIYFDNK
jgi:hypothetical protein